MNTDAQPTPSGFRLRPEDIEVNPDAPFEHDRLDREPFVQATVELLQAIREPFVIALNAPWGSGKTTTLRLLEPTLESADIYAIRFNAWEVDDATDPLVPLVAALHNRLLSIKGFNEGIKHGQVQKLKKLGSAVVKHGSIAAVKIATAGLLDINQVSDDVGKAVKDAGEDIATDLIDAFKLERKVADQFQALLSELIAHARGTDDQNDRPPLVLMVDELDRCRPTFAVSMLERIKHFFHIPGLVFILAIDMSQLKASTRKVYGAELDATEYLRRFIDLELSLPPAKVDGMINAMLSNCGADEFFFLREKNFSAFREERTWVVATLASLANHFDLSLRIVQRMVSRLMLVIRQTPNNAYLDATLVVFMIFLRLKDENLLRKFVSGQAQADAIMKAVRASHPGGQAFYDSHMGKLIEAYLLFAHNERHDYVEAYISQVQDIQPEEASAEQKRLLDVVQRFNIIKNEHFTRRWTDLHNIDRRINLVSSDLKQR